jgi:hypothetical protein
MNISQREIFKGSWITYTYWQMRDDSVLSNISDSDIVVDNGCGGGESHSRN